MAIDSIFSRGIRRFCSWIVRRGNDERPMGVVITPLISQPGEHSDSPIPVFDLTSHVVDDDTVVRSDGSSGDPLHAARYEHGLWRIAWSDGRLGVDPDSQNELINAQAALTWQTRIARVRADLEKARAAEKFRGVDHQQAKDDWEAAKKEHDKVSVQQRRDPAGFSRLLGGIYLFAALAILIADMPLSLLVAAGLGIEIVVRDGNPTDLVNLYENLSSSWEALAVALGVAALTISFKLVIDPLYMRDDEGEDKLRNVRTVLRVGALIAAAAGTISAFVVMGHVRAAYMQAAPGSSATPDAKDVRYLFSLLAILFPLIAAFCLSMSRLCWQNASRLGLAAKGLRNAWQQYRIAQQPYEAAQAERAAVEERLTAMSNPHTDETFLRELYTHAFDRGWAVPETRMPAASLYERCAHLMHRALSRIEQLDNA